jgi:multiple sugar transport system permease protein
MSIHQSEAISQRFKRDIAYQIKIMKKHRKHYLFMLPFTVLFIAFVIVPVGISIFFSFTSFNILEPPVFVGLQNYFKLFLNDDVFMIAIKNTLLFAVITGPIGYLIALLFAWMINDLHRGLRVMFTVIFYAPSISGGMAVIWNYLFNGDAKGFLNAQLMRMGVIQDPIQFLQDPKYMVGIMIVIILWMSLGTTFLSFIAGFQGIDRQYYEAGAIDGIKNRWQELWFITLPLMRPQLMFGAVMNITAAFGIGDIITQVLGFPSVDYTAHTVMNHLTDYGTIRYEMGYACAIATLLFVTMILCNKIVQALLRKVGE